MTFIEDAVKGKAIAKDIEKYIDMWHELPENIDFYEFMGLTEDEYGDYLTTPGVEGYQVVENIINKNKNMENKK